jgi:Ca-activated chloride channel family protein
MQMLLSLCFLVFGNFSDHPRTMDASSSLIFILDASGSMWGKIGDDHKITIAREVLGDLIDGLDDNREIGLVAYGHRQKSDCEDIEWLLAPASGQRAALKSSLTTVNPTGMTPLAQTAQHVIDALRKDGTSATIIMITDGQETCKGDLCTVVADAKKAGIDFVLHIVGFDLGNSDKTALECAARAGNGLYLDASNSDELGNALDEVSELTLENTGAELRVKSTKGGALIDATVNVYRKGTTDRVAALRTYSQPSTNPCVFHLPVGIYDIEVNPVGLRGVLPVTFGDVQIVEDTMTEKHAEFSSGMISITVTSNGALHDASIMLKSQTTGESVAGGRSYQSASSNPRVIEVNPDRYTVTVKSVTIDGPGHEQVFRDVIILPGEKSSLTCEIPHGILRLGATSGGKLWDCTVSVHDKSTDQNVASGRTYTTGTSNPKSFTLAPGEYTVVVKPLKLDAEPKTLSVVIAAGKTLVSECAF